MADKFVHRVGICDTTLRDGHQSLLATRLSTEHILEVASLMDEVGYAACEVWGGATFDTCMRFLNENPFERLRKIRAAMPKTKLQMLLRGQNLVGYRHYSDHMVDEFVKASVANGIDIIRIFDALNDLRNLERAMAAAKAEGAHVQGAVAYTISPVHNIEYFTKASLRLKELGADSICIKDMAGLLLPAVAYDLVKSIKEATGLPIQLHSHYTSGLASMSYLKAVEAGADVLDCASSAFALATSQPAEESMIAALQGTPYDTHLDLDKINPITVKLKEIRKDYAAFDSTDYRVDTNVLRYQMPGGMISNFLAQLRDQGASDRLDECLAEVPRVRADMGYPPLVTPSSQIVGSQALLNVLMGERYKMATSEVKSYFKGEYGQPPAPMNEEVRHKVIGDAAVITCRPADLIPDDFETARHEIGAYARDEEDLLMYIMFPAVAKKFLEDRLAAETRVEYAMVGEEKNEAGETVHYVHV